jgi:hypothetical protein
VCTPADDAFRNDLQPVYIDQVKGVYMVYSNEAHFDMPMKELPIVVVTNGLKQYCSTGNTFEPIY